MVVGNLFNWFESKHSSLRQVKEEKESGNSVMTLSFSHSDSRAVSEPNVEGSLLSRHQLA